MTPKEKAKDWVEKFIPLCAHRKQEGTTISIGISVQSENAKQCALICVEEVLNNLNEQEMMESGKMLNCFDQEYWQQVKHEINLL